MNKRYMILTPKNCGECVICEEPMGNRYRANVTLKNCVPLAHNQLYKLHGILDNKEELIGSLENYVGVFVYKYSYDSFLIYRKDLDTEVMELEFFNNNVDKNLKKKVSGNDMFEIFNGYFNDSLSWKRVNGYYNLYNYDIIQYILSNTFIKQNINKNSYYFVGEKTEENTHYIAIAVLGTYSDVALLKDFESSITTLEGQLGTYYIICVGIDEKGEFFLNNLD